MIKIVRQWTVHDELVILYLEEEIPRYEPYRAYRIDGAIYNPVPMSHANGKCIAIQGAGDFVGKTVEFISQEP